MSKNEERKKYKRVTDKQILDALEDTGGNKSAAARLLGVTRDTITKRIKKKDNMSVKADEIKNRNLDKAETKLQEKIEEGNIQAIMFYLRTIGRDRGYAQASKFDPIDRRLTIEVEYKDDKDKD